MDNISKFLKKLTSDERLLVHKAINQLLSGYTQKLDIKKLKGFEDIYRVRVRDIRIIYRSKNETVSLIEIARRSDKTYKNY